MKKSCFLVSVLVLAVGIHGAWSALEKPVPAAPAKDKSPYAGEMIYLRDFGSDEVGFLSVPMQQPQFGVLIVPDGRGLDGRVKKLCDTLSAQGYLALAVDIYNGRVVEDDVQAKANRKGLDAETAIKALETGLNFYAKSPRFQMQRVAAVALGDADGIVLSLCRQTKNRSLVVVSLVGGTALPDTKIIRQRVQRLETASAADPAGLVRQLHEFWNLPETKKNFFERLVE